jgi:TPR repeat protein
MQKFAVCTVLIPILSLTFADVAFGTMPTLSEMPAARTPAKCSTWAASQDEDALAMWGIQSTGKSSELTAIDRLARFCMGEKKPDIVGFGSSVGFDDQYCLRHKSEQVCLDRKKQDNTLQAAELLSKASLAAQRGSFEEAFRIWEPPARSGNAEAQHNLGIMYYFGEGLRKDHAKALMWRKKAADQGHAAAQLDIGVMYSNGEGVRRDDKVATSWYMKSAMKGNARAQFNLGSNYETGAGVQLDKGEALKWYLKAAEQNDADAQLAAARLYGDQASSRYDPSLAKQMYGLAALNNKPEAQLALGVMYSKGRGVTIDPVRAAMWFKIASGFLGTDLVRMDSGSPGKEASRLLDEVGRGMTKDQTDAANAMASRCLQERNVQKALSACGLE